MRKNSGGKDEIQRIKNLMSLYPKGLTIEEVSKKLTLNRATAAKYLNALVLSGQADCRELGRAKLFTRDWRVPLTDIINLLPDPLIILDKDLLILNVNDALLQYLSFSRESLMKIRLDQSALNSYLTLDFYAYLKNALDGTSSTHEISLEWDNSLRSFRIRFISIVSDEGTQGAGVIFEDITDSRRYQLDLEERVRERTSALATANTRLKRTIAQHQRTLAALRESEFKYRRIIETANEAIWVGDLSYTILYANQKFAELLGYANTNSLIGKNIAEFLFPEDIPDHFLKVAERKKGQKGSYERCYCRHDKSRCWTLVSATPIVAPSGEFCGSFAMLTDITSQKDLERRLEQRSRYYELLLNTSTDAIHIVDKDMNLREWNTAFLEHLGYSDKEAASLRLPDWDITIKNEYPRERREILESGKPLWFETHHKRKDGTIRDVEITASRICIDGEQMICASARDITEHRQVKALPPG